MKSHCRKEFFKDSENGAFLKKYINRFFFLKSSWVLLFVVLKIWIECGSILYY